MNARPSLFDSERMTMPEAIELTASSLQAYGDRHDHWAIAYSGGKDSTTVLTLVMHLIRTGRVARPKRLTVCYADTRMELPPLASAASRMLAMLASEGVETRVAVAPLDKRFLVYMLGRGVPPPNNSTFRWCTRQIKIEPMESELESLAVECGFGYLNTAGNYRSHDQDVYEIDPGYRLAAKRLAEAKRAGAGDAELDRLGEGVRLAALAVVPNPTKVLMLTGVRIGESASRDAKIAMSCGKNGAECGQGWYQETLPASLCDTLAPILHWRTCLVWDWLCIARDYGFPTAMDVAKAYGHADEGSEAENAARTGCNGCPLATVDLALDNLLANPKWAYLAPLKELRPLFRWLREPANRLRKPGFERSKSGKIRWTNRMGPITFAARRQALAKIIDIQARCNAMRPDDADPVDTLNAEEIARIEELIGAGAWPERWDGDEPTGDVPFERRFRDGSLQREMFQIPI